MYDGDSDESYDQISSNADNILQNPQKEDIIPSIIWSDKAASNVQLNTQDWFTEAKIPGINDLGTQTLNE